ncbi:MAG: hypothetical protein ACRCTS_10215 [Fusobacteriaceae bacterium]
MNTTISYIDSNSSQVSFIIESMDLKCIYKQESGHLVKSIILSSVSEISKSIFIPKLMKDNPATMSINNVPVFNIVSIFLIRASFDANGYFANNDGILNLEINSAQ